MPADDAQRHAMDENRAWWDAATPVHYRSGTYDVRGFLAGRNTINRFELEEVGDVRGKRLLHLQCHFGQDTLSWARLGAEVTGVDYSPEAVATARQLAADADLNAEFVESNIYDLGNRFDGQFDLVYTSWGVLIWLPDLARWGRLIAGALRPGGSFYIAECHPTAWMLDNDREDPVTRSADLVAKYPYFPEEGAVRFVPGPGGAPDYADPDHRNTLPTNEWPHSLSEIIGSLTVAGLQIENFVERPVLTWQLVKGMVQGDDGLWRMPPGVIQYPLSFSLKARKPA